MNRRMVVTAEQGLGEVSLKDSALSLSIRERLELAREIAKLETDLTAKQSRMKGQQRVPMSYGTVNELIMMLTEVQSAGLGECPVSLHLLSSQWSAFPGEARTSQNRPRVRSLEVQISQDNDDTGLEDDTPAQSGITVFLCNSWPQPVRQKKLPTKHRIEEDVADDDEDDDE